MTNNFSVGKQTNCINLIKLMAAFQVMAGHFIKHLKLPVIEPVRLAVFFFNGVPIFFALSGFLIWFSISNSSSIKEYFKKRFWRIYPELWFAVLIELLILLILYDCVEWKSFLLFGFGQSTVFQFWTPNSLRGYGVGTPNGTLWTIGVIIQFYIIAWPFQKLMKGKRMKIWSIGFVVSFLISFVGSYMLHQVIGIEIVDKLYGQTILKYFWLFYIGMFISEFRTKLLPVFEKKWWILIGVSVLFYITHFDLYSGYYLLWSMTLAAGLIGFAYRFSRLSVSIDISYGLFLYHMTVVNIFVNFGLVGKWAYALNVLVITIFIALISTVTIGHLSARRKMRIINNGVTIE